MIMISDFQSHGYIELRLRHLYENQDPKLVNIICAESTEESKILAVAHATRKSIRFWII